MKNFLRKLCTGAALLACACAFAQPMQQMPPELTDPNVRTGKLENGLTYYIRHNEYPKGQADFHIAQKVGAVQEEEHQNGLAHFLEHMCFNGTKNFPEKQIITWLESIGVKFGANLNAHTGTDETVYDIMNVPVSRETVVDSCLLILHDWADALTLADKEIEKERGVIHEEWRMGNSAFSRILNRHAKELYPNTKYATHDVIGSMDVIDNFKPQVLRDYYEKWYRPDLQGIIVVGDINVDQIEQKIKTLFSSIKMPENPAKFDYQHVADNETPIIISDKDKELAVNMVFVAQKYDFLPREIRNTDAYLTIDYLNQLAQIMLNQRFMDITLGTEPPFANCGMYMGSYLYASTKGAMLMQAVVNDKGAEAALRSVLTEMKRVREFGFTATEYDRARSEYLSQLEKEYNNRATNKNNVYAQTYIRHFINNTPIAEIDYIYGKMKMIAPMLPVEAINEYMKEMISNDGKNLVVISFSPDKEGIVMPTTEALSKVVEEVKASKVEGYVDNTVNEPLISELPKPGSIVRTTENTKIGYTELELSNGAKVLLKPTTFKEDEIMLKAVSEGGASLYPGSDYPNIAMASDIMTTTGIGKFSYSDFMKIMSGKQASVTPYIDDYEEGMIGKTTPKDLETMMQLLYLNFTQPREDKATFENVKKLVLSQVENIAHDPQYVFQDSLVRTIFGHHPKAMIQGKEMMERLDYERMLAIYKERFANAADFTFIITGNFDMEQMKEYVEQYIASLPSTGGKEKAANDGRAIVKGMVKNQFMCKSENNLAMLAMIWSGNLPYTLENKVKTSIAGQLMANQLLNNVREDEGAAYSPYSTGQMNRSYNDYFLIQTSFSLNPDKREKSEKTTIACLESLAKEIPEAELNKMKEYMLKRADEQMHENGYWLNTMEDFAMNGVDNVTGYKELVKNLTAKDMKNFIASLLKQGNRCEVIMIPE